MTHRKHPAARRRPEQHAEHPDDILVAKVTGFAEWAREHSQGLVVGGVIVVLLVAAGLYWRNYRISLRQQAVTQLEQVEQAAAFGDRATAKSQLLQYIARFDGTPYAAEARLVLAQLQLEEGQPTDAIGTLEPALGSLEEPIQLQVGFLLATAYEQADRAQDAERIYLRLADAAELPFQIREALASAARIRAQRGEYAAAAELYRRVLTTFEETDPGRRFYEMRLAEMEARA